MLWSSTTTARLYVELPSLRAITKSSIVLKSHDSSPLTLSVKFTREGSLGTLNLTTYCLLGCVFLLRSLHGDLNAASRAPLFLKLPSVWISLSAKHLKANPFFNK